MNVIPMPEEEYLTKAFVLAEESLKLDNISLRKAMYTAKKGTRWSTHHAYLQKAWNRKNLHILMNTLVAKVFIIFIVFYTYSHFIHIHILYIYQARDKNLRYFFLKTYSTHFIPENNIYI